MKRPVTEDERKLFEQDFRLARPIKPAKPKAIRKKPVALPASGGTGINGATEERLKKGLLEPQARIDLHGMTQETAHRTLFAFLATAHARGHRLVLVVTGKGNPRKDEGASWMQSPHGVLKQMVPRWLNEAGLAALIASTKPAHVRHGGDGALYVYLRKNR
jgi:DNA-nicking Smr family endonuclease